MAKYEIENAECIHQTKAAILIEAPEFKEPQWIPYKLIDDSSEVYKKGTTGVLIIPEWFAVDKGWV